MKQKKRAFSDMTPYLYVAPAMLFMVAIIFYPMLSSAFISAMEWNGIGAMRNIGIENYRRLFLADSTFWQSMATTFIWVILSTTILTLTSLLLAIVIEFGIARKGMIAVTRTILFMPMTMSLVSIGVLWSLIYNPLLGLLAKVLTLLGAVNAVNPPDFLGSSSTAIFAVFVPVIWQWSGFGMVIFSAAIQGIPAELLEASIVDGCGRTKQIRHIVIPLLKPSAAILTTVNCIGAFKAFDIIYIMTAGGPSNATMVSTIYMFRQAFVDNCFGYSAAISVALFAVAAFFGIVCMKLSQRTESYF
jgi:ABC-type sugar transport system permease subunit